MNSHKRIREYVEGKRNVKKVRSVTEKKRRTNEELRRKNEEFH